MNDNFLSQEEINALLNKSLGEDSEEIEETERDIIGEIGNISMSTAATTLSSILNRRVLITTPKVSWIPFEQIVEELEIPKVVANIQFKNGLKGNNLLMMDVKDSAIIADLMMGGNGETAGETLSELELSAVAEAMNQMIGSASTAMATMLEREIDILPPEVNLWDMRDNIDFTKVITEKYICRIAFDLDVEGLIKSEIMQIYTKNTVKEIVDLMTAGNAQVEEDVYTKEEDIDKDGIQTSRSNTEEELPKASKDKIAVQKPVFPPLTENTDPARKQPRNLDLIMDVPLEFSVVLGKTKKSIKEILSFSNGSVVELNKLADEALEIYVNGKLIANGEVVVINENFGIRITNILSKEQRVKNLN